MRRSGKHGHPRDERKRAQKIFRSQTSQLPNPKSGPIQFRLLKHSRDTESKPTVPKIGKPRPWKETQAKLAGFSGHISSKPGLSCRWRSGPCTQNRFCPHLVNSAPDAPLSPNSSKTRLKPHPRGLRGSASAGLVWNSYEVQLQQPLPCPFRRLYPGRARTAGV